MDFFLRRLGLGGLVVSLVLGLLGGRRLGDRAQKLLHRQLVAIIGELLGEFRGLVELVGHGLPGGELEIDQVVENVFLPGRALELLRQAGADVGHGDGDVLVGDRRAVDLGQNLGIGRGGAGEHDRRAEPERQRGGGRA